MKEKPIIYSTAMVKARRAGLKTQTRRIIKNKKIIEIYNNLLKMTLLQHYCKYQEIINESPYQIGQTVWIRETWSLPSILDNDKPRDINPENKKDIKYKADDERASGKLRPSIFMPRWAARSFDRITNIRIERIQDISEEDAKAEGIIFIDYGKNKWGNQKPGYNIKEKAEKGPEWCLDSARYGLGNLWDSINKKRGYGWDLNPYVWVYDFEVIK